MQITAVKRQALEADVEKNELAKINIQHLTAQSQILQGQAAIMKEAEKERAKAEQEEERKRRGQAAYEKLGEKSKLTIEELAALDPRQRQVAGGGDLNRDIMRAREVQRLEARAAAEQKTGHEREAFRDLARAQQIRAHMGSLKESEKTLHSHFRKRSTRRKYSKA